jgi:hypothetical protein
MAALVIGWYQETEVGYRPGPKCAIWRNNIKPEEMHIDMEQAEEGLRWYKLVVMAPIDDAMDNQFYRKTFAPALRRFIGALWKAGQRGVIKIEKEEEIYGNQQK